MAALTADFSQQLQATDAGQAVIDNQQVGPAVAAVFEDSGAVLQHRKLDVATRLAHQLGEQLGAPAIRVGDQHTGCPLKFSHGWRSCSAVAPGNGNFARTTQVGVPAD
ncbi:hypothetical protein D3C80_1679430 [compost metagenome]